MSGTAAPRPYQSRASTTFSRPGHGNEHALVPVIGLGPTGFRWPAHFWVVPSFAYKSCSPNPSVVSSRTSRRRTVATRASNDRWKKQMYLQGQEGREEEDVSYLPSSSSFVLRIWNRWFWPVPWCGHISFVQCGSIQQEGPVWYQGSASLQRAQHRQDPGVQDTGHQGMPTLRFVWVSYCCLRLLWLSSGCLVDLLLNVTETILLGHLSWQARPILGLVQCCLDLYARQSGLCTCFLWFHWSMYLDFSPVSCEILPTTKFIWHFVVLLIKHCSQFTIVLFHSDLCWVESSLWNGTFVDSHICYSFI